MRADDNDLVDVDLYDDGSFPEFRFRQAPKGLATRRQLRAMNLSPGGHEPVAQITWRSGKHKAWLYRIDLAKPKRMPTLAQEQALDRAMAARPGAPRLLHPPGDLHPGRLTRYARIPMKETFMATTRTLTAEQAGPITIDAQMLGLSGIVMVRTKSTIKNAEITIRTADDSGDSADAVRAADLRWDPRGSLVAHVRGKGGGGGLSQTVITGGGRGRRVTQVVSGNSGSTVIMSGGNISVGGTVVVNGRVITGSDSTVIIGGSSVEIEAVVPEDSSVIGRTDSADLAADGTFAAVAGNTQSGDVRVQGTSEQVTAGTQSGDVTVGDSPNIVAKTQSGDVRLGRTDVADAHTMSGDIRIKDFGGTAKLKTMSGAIGVHATAGGDIDANTMSGDIEVTATQAALDDALDVRPHTMSGHISVPRRQNTSGGPRRRRS